MLDLTKKKNKGEWSETLSLLKILSSPEWKISKGTQFGKKTDEFLEIAEIKESIDSKIIYRNKSETEFLINQKVHQKKDFEDIFNSFFDEVLNANERTFLIKNKEVINFLENTELPGKASSKKKADLVFKFSNEDSFEGASLKSSIGAFSSLINSSRHTLISYELITNENFNLAEANAENYVESVKYVDENTSDWEVKIESDIYRKSLEEIDKKLPELIGSVVFHSYLCSPDRTLKNIFKKYPFINEEKEIIEKFLLASFGGLMPARQWDHVLKCKCLIDLKRDGSLLIYRYEENGRTLKNFLFNTAKFDTPSSRDSYIDQYVEDNNKKKKMYLNLKLRMNTDLASK